MRSQTMLLLLVVSRECWLWVWSSPFIPWSCCSSCFVIG